MLNKNFSKIVLATFCLLILLGFSISRVAQAQDNWVAMPPYNTLWPLWSNVLSPFDAVTGVPTPVVTSLASSTVLPVEPALTWDPSLAYPWLLYNTPSGMAYFDPLYGVDFWPPSSLLDSAGAPLPIDLPLDYNLLPPTDTLWLQQNVLLANTYFVQAYSNLVFYAPTTTLPAALAAAVAAGIPIPPTYPATLFPPPDITGFLTPADLLGL